MEREFQFHHSVGLFQRAKSEAGLGVIERRVEHGLHIGPYRAEVILEAVLGKNVGDDLAEGKVTLPLIVALRQGAEDEKSFIKETILKGGTERLGEVIELARSTGGLRYTWEAANKQRCLALDDLESLSESPYKDAMTTLINFVVDRQS